jgi:hypothetical protein
MLVALLETSQLSCPRCGAAINEVGDSCREVGSWIFLDCPSCRLLSDVTFSPIWRSFAAGA